MPCEYEIYVWNWEYNDPTAHPFEYYINVDDYGKELHVNTDPLTGGSYLFPYPSPQFGSRPADDFNLRPVYLIGKKGTPCAGQSLRFDNLLDALQAEKFDPNIQIDSDSVHAANQALIQIISNSIIVNNPYTLSIQNWATIDLDKMFGKGKSLLLGVVAAVSAYRASEKNTKKNEKILLYSVAALAAYKSFSTNKS